MLRIAVMALGIYLAAAGARCYAASCSCEDWMEKGGYCVDYIKTHIPSFPIPTKEDMVELKNTAVDNVTEGDVAVFTVKNYWHVAYVERVHRDPQGEPVALDLSEMNYGGELSFPEFKARFKSTSEAQWSRAVCCGVTDRFDEVSYRKNVEIATVKQVWSPDDVRREWARRQVKAMLGKVKEVINRFIDFDRSEL